MANDWIKIRVNLPDDPKVKVMARRLGVSEEVIVCGLVRIWSLADQHAVSEKCPENVHDFVGQMSGYCPDDIDRVARVPGLAEAMASVGWLIIRTGGVAFPEWEIHHSKSAKTRACDAKRKQQERKARPKNVREMSEKCPGEIWTRERERVNTEDPPTPLEGGSDHPYIIDCQSGSPTSEDENTPSKPDDLESIRNPKVRRETASDHPHLFPVAKRIAKHFDAKVRSAHPSKNHTSSIIVALLLNNHSEEDLLKCVEAYGKHCDTNELEFKTRSPAHRFFSDTGSYLQFLPSKSENGPAPTSKYVPPPMPQKPRMVE